MALRKSLSNERGASMLEYVMMIAMVAIACLSGLHDLGSNMAVTFEVINDTVVAASAGFED